MSSEAGSSGCSIETPDWEKFEFIVAFIEKVINPDAVVEHDVWLYEHRAKRKVQCDVVIKNGKPPRDTLTIVEVQKRKKKVDRHTFNVWCAKRDNVRAQHLICVSQKGFDKTVVETAKEEGKGARLVTVMKPESISLPLTFENGQLVVFIPKPRVVGYSLVAGGIVPSQFEAGSAWFTRDGKRIGLNELTRYPVQPSETEVEYTDWHTTHFSTEDDVVLILNGCPIPVQSITTEVLVQTERVVLAVDVRDYIQLDYDGVLAWYFEGTGVYNGQKASLILILAKKESGLFDGALIFADAFAELGPAIETFTMKYTKPV